MHCTKQSLVIRKILENLPVGEALGSPSNLAPRKVLISPLCCSASLGLKVFFKHEMHYSKLMVSGSGTRGFKQSASWILSMYCQRVSLFLYLL